MNLTQAHTFELNIPEMPYFRYQFAAKWVSDNMPDRPIPVTRNLKLVDRYPAGKERYAAAADALQDWVNYVAGLTKARQMMEEVKFDTEDAEEVWKTSIIGVMKMHSYLEKHLRDLSKMNSIDSIQDTVAFRNWVGLSQFRGSTSDIRNDEFDLYGWRQQEKLIP